MCSILGSFDLRPGADLTPLRHLALSLSARQRHRGPDWSGVHARRRALLVPERPATVTPAGGAHPIRSADGTLVLADIGDSYTPLTPDQSLPACYVFRTSPPCPAN